VNAIPTHKSVRLCNEHSPCHILRECNVSNTAQRSSTAAYSVTIGLQFECVAEYFSLLQSTFKAYWSPI